MVVSSLALKVAGASPVFSPHSESPPDLNVRWKGMIESTRQDGPESVQALHRLKKSKSWEARSAALVAAADVYPELAKRWAIELLKDQALMVRLSAVRTLGDLKDQSSAPALWTALEDPTHYRRGTSLFIRRRIVEALGQVTDNFSQQERSRFEYLLHDSDPLVRAEAARVLASKPGSKLRDQM